MAVDFVEEVYVGQTVRVYAKDLTDVDDGPITSGAAVTINLYGPDNVLVEEGTVSNDDDDWYANFQMPSMLGTYTAKLSASYLGKVWKGLGYIVVRPI